jgi:hypothetical protein
VREYTLVKRVIRCIVRWMLQGLRRAWSNLRASRRQCQIERAVFKASGGVKQFEHRRDGDLSGIRGDGGAGSSIGTGGMYTLHATTRPYPAMVESCAVERRSSTRGG